MLSQQHPLSDCKNKVRLIVPTHVYLFLKSGKDPVHSEIINFQGYHQKRRQKKHMQNMHRVLKKGATIIIASNFAKC